MKSFVEEMLPFTTPKNRKIMASYRTWPKTEFNVCISLEYSDMKSSLLYVAIYRLPHPFAPDELPADLTQFPRELSDETISKVNQFVEADFPNMLATADRAIDDLIAHLTH